MELIFNIIPEAIGAFIGFFGAFLIIKYQLNREKKRIEKARIEEEKLTARFFAVLIENTKPTIRKQIKEFNEYSELILANPYLQLRSIPHYPVQDLNRIISLMSEKNTWGSFLSIVGDQKNSITEYDQISKCLEYIDIGYRLIEDDAKRRFQLDYDRRLEYNQSVDRQLHRLLNYSAENLFHFRELFDFVLNLRNTMEQTVDLNLHSKTVVQPVIDFLLNKKYDDPNIKAIYYELNRAMVLVDQTRDNNEFFAKLVKSIKVDFQNTLNKLEFNSRNLKIKLGIETEDKLELKSLESEKLKEGIVLANGPDQSSSPI